MMIADFHDCNADCPPDCKYKDTTSAHSRFKIYHFNNHYFKQFHFLKYIDGYIYSFDDVASVFIFLI